MKISSSVKHINLRFAEQFMVCHLEAASLLASHKKFRTVVKH